MLRFLASRSSKCTGKFIEINGIFSWRSDHGIHPLRSGFGVNSANSIRRFTDLRTSPIAVRPFVDDNNVFRSPFGDVDISTDYLHQHVWRNVDKWWDKTAVECALTGRSYAYGELRKLSGRFATSLRKKLLPGDTLAVVLPNIPEFAIVALGASEAGVKVTLVNPTYTAYEISKQLENSESKVVITLPQIYPVISESIKAINNPNRPSVVIISGGSESTPSDTTNFRDLIADGIEEFERTGERTGADAARDTVFLPYSSGTTGLPKGVELTHRNIVANMCQVEHPEYHHSEPALGNFQEVIPQFLPFFHIYGLTICLQVYLSWGAKLICMPQFTPNNFLDVLEKNPVTMLYLAPPIVQLMVYDDRFKAKHMTYMKSVISGAAPIGSDLIAKLYSKLGTNFQFCQGYGLTETSPCVTRGKNAAVDSCGLVIPNTELRVVGTEDNNFGKNLGTKECGEIVVRGPQVMKGYYKNPKATADCTDGDWFKTGDLGFIDDKGQLYITGRLKELIKVQGFQVSPVELECLIQGHERVADAAVIGVPHQRLGEVPKAFVVPKPGAKVTEEEIKSFVSERLSKHKQLGHVVFLDKIPKSAAGKILRKELHKI